MSIIWTPIEEAPKSAPNLLLFYLNEIGHSVYALGYWSEKRQEWVDEEYDGIKPTHFSELNKP